MREAIEPTVSEGRTGQCDPHERYNHPAYGTITLTTTLGGGDKTLFGSDLGHNQRVCIRVNTATLKRDLNHDWIHTDKQLIELEMSHAQFAQFITSNGNGSGTPCTLKFIRGEGDVPAIKNIETKHETFRREVRDAAASRLQHIKQGLDSLRIMLEAGGSISKKELREIHANLERHAAQLPGTMEYVVKSAEEALEKATSDAKIEVESFVHMTAQRLGLKSVNDLAQLADKSAECNHLYSRSMNQEYPRKCLHCGQPEKE